MKLTRPVTLTALALSGALTVSACGSDNTTSTASGSQAPSSAASTAASSGSSTSAANIGGVPCATGSLTLAGSTAQSNAMSVWIKNYQLACQGAQINYGGGGSGAGVTQFQQGTIDFAGSDFPLNAKNHPGADKRCGSGNTAIDLPLVPGPIAIGYNLPGVSDLNLSATALAEIFSGKVTKWNDPAIAKDNSGVKLPSTPIQTFHRSDGSGTSFNFTNYLTHEAKAAWSYGANKTWPAPGGQGSKGTQGIAQGVKSTPGGVGYMEQSFATQSNISVAKVGNAGGAFVPLTGDNAVNFLSKATVAGTGNDLALSFDYTNTDATAYPNLLVTYEIVCQKGNEASKLPLIKSFLSYLASDAGQAILPANGYIKLPANVDAQARSAIATIS